MTLPDQAILTYMADARHGSFISAFARACLVSDDQNQAWLLEAFKEHRPDRWAHFKTMSERSSENKSVPTW